MKVIRLVVGDLATNCYIIVNENNEALVIDPGDDVNKIKEALSFYNLVEVLVTHSHFDHIGGYEEIKKGIGSCSSSFSYEIIATPGHTSDSISFYFPALHAVFVGDFIFKQGIGRCDLGGNIEDMKSSLKFFIERFPSSILLYPGHGEATTLEEEKGYLEFLISHL